jgi:hypothetical protein
LATSSLPGFFRQFLLLALSYIATGMSSLARIVKVTAGQAKSDKNIISKKWAID